MVDVPKMVPFQDIVQIPPTIRELYDRCYIILEQAIPYGQAISRINPYTHTVVQSIPDYEEYLRMRALNNAYAIYMSKESARIRKETEKSCDATRRSRERVLNSRITELEKKIDQSLKKKQHKYFSVCSIVLAIVLLVVFPFISSRISRARDAGYEEGFSAGETAGYSSGYEAAFSSGKNVGYSSGYIDGVNSVPPSQPYSSGILGSSDNNLSSTAAYIGNKNTKKFHLPSCSYLPAKSNQIYFSSRPEAIASGFDPCGHCHP